MKDLEAEFKLVEKEVHAKIKENMKEAAKLINESSKLVKKYGKTLGNDPSNDDDDYDPFEFDKETSILMKALDNAGWRTSSLGC